MTDRERFALVNGTALGWLLAIIALLLNFHVDSTTGMVLVILGVTAAYFSENAVVMRWDFVAGFSALLCIALVAGSYLCWFITAVG